LSLFLGLVVVLGTMIVISWLGEEGEGDPEGSCHIIGHDWAEEENWRGRVVIRCSWCRRKWGT